MNAAAPRAGVHVAGAGTSGFPAPEPMLVTQQERMAILMRRRGITQKRMATLLRRAGFPHASDSVVRNLLGLRPHKPRGPLARPVGKRTVAMAEAMAKILEVDDV